MLTKYENNFLKENLQFLMQKYDISLPELSDRIEGISYETLAKLKRGDSVNPNLKTLISLSKCFDVNLDDLIFVDLSKNTEINRTSSNSKSSQERLIPIADWEQIDSWMISKNMLLIDYIENEKIFALYLEKEMGDLIGDSYIIIDTKKEPKNNDYILIENQNSKNVFVKRVIYEDAFYVESLLLDKKIVEYDRNDNKIIGVIIGYQKLKIF